MFSRSYAVFPNHAIGPRGGFTYLAQPTARDSASAKEIEAIPGVTTRLRASSAQPLERCN